MRIAFVALVLGAFVACGKFAAEEDEGTQPLPDRADADLPDEASASIPDAGPPDAVPPKDAGPDVLVTGKSWTSPNGASHEIADGGVRIVAYQSANHPVIVPAPQLASPSDDYTVHATIVAPTAGAPSREFGLVARIQTSGDCVVFGSQYGGQPTPFVDVFGPPSWNPVALAGPTYTFTAGARHHMKLKISGLQASGKIWRAIDPEPATFQVTKNHGWATGRGVGFYTYLVNGAVLESLQVTVP